VKPVADTDRVCLGVVVGAQGVRGEVRIKAFTEDPLDVDAYGPVTDEPGEKTLRLSVRGRAKGAVVARIDGIADRNAAEALKGTLLYVPRDRLPEPENADTFYHADLVGLEARTPDGAPLGAVVAVFDHGAGDVLDILRVDGKPASVPFTKAVVPEVNLAEGYLVVDWSEGPDDAEMPRGGENE